MNNQTCADEFDLFIIGGGINGCGIARDAAGRGLSVALCEMGDLAQATSSGSTKLFHGGLRYLEYYEFRLVREALIERERLLTAMPHISWPLRFVLPHHKGLRPAWLLRLGLFIYDHLGGRKILPPTKTLDLRTDRAGVPLKNLFTKGFEYSDCWVDDARLVVLNARDAAARGALIRTRSKVESARRENGLWQISVRNLIDNSIVQYRAKSLVNCAGPWVAEILQQGLHLKSKHGVRLVRGSHIVTRRLFDHDRAYIFQQADGRIIFAIPYEDNFTLIGTTDVDHQGDPAQAQCTPEERDYLLSAASEYFKQPLSTEDVVWSYSGVRPLYDDNASSATAATRDYVLKIDSDAGRAPVLNVFGGKITTYRKLAEAALDELARFHKSLGKPWTAEVALPGGDFNVADKAELDREIARAYPFLSEAWRRRMIRTYGTDTFKILGNARKADDLGVDFGGSLTEAEVRWQIENEWALQIEDVIWRRTKLGLLLTADERSRLEQFISEFTAASSHNAYTFWEAK